MTSEKEPDRTGGENPRVETDVAGRGDEGDRAADVTPPIGDDAEREQTQVPAAEDDVGVPPDEEMEQPEQ
jgi:hypothetical protein